MGIKVCLKNGKIGRIINIPKDYEINVERMKVFNNLFYSKQIHAIWNKSDRKYIVIPSKYGNIVFLFLSKEDTLEFMKEKHIKGNEVPNTINRNKLIIENFKTLHVDCFVINQKLKVSFDKLKELEMQFNNLSK